MLSLSAMLQPVTRQQALDTLLGFLTDLGFRTTSWQPGSVQRTLVTACAWLYAGGTTAIRNLARGGYPGTAEGDWLDYVGNGWFQDTRIDAVATEGLVTLVADGTAGSHSWGVDELVLSDTEDGSGNVYRVAEAGAIVSNETRTFTFRAVVPGSSANIASTLSGRTMYLLTPLAGVTAKIVSDPTSETWITVSGTDRESDARYRARMLARWGTLTYGSGDLAYRRWALEAAPTVTRVSVIQGVDERAVRVICATAAGATPGPTLTTIANYIEDGRRPINDLVTVESANPLNFAVTAAPVIRRGATTSGVIEQALADYFELLPIGGRRVYPSTIGQVLLEDLIETILGIDGVLRARVSYPTADLPMSSTDVAVPTYSLTVTEVAEER